MFAVHLICVQDSSFEMSGVSPDWTVCNNFKRYGSIELMVRLNEGPCGFDGGLKLKNSL